MASDNLQPQSESGDNSGYLIPAERVESAILEIRGQKVILSRDLASLYGVSTRRLNEQAKRNIGRFPPDFMFQISWEEAEALMSQSAGSAETASRSQNATLKRGRNIKYRPFAFTEHGAVMAATILNTPRAIEVSVFVVRAFVRLSRVAANYRQLALRLGELEAKFASHDKNFRVVFDALRKLMQPPQPEPRGPARDTSPISGRCQVASAGCARQFKLQKADIESQNCGPDSAAKAGVSDCRRNRSLRIVETDCVVNR